MKEQHGLNLYGETIIKGEGGVVARRVFDAWRELFDCGPAELILTGAYTSRKESEEEGGYEKVLFLKSNVIENLTRLVRMFDQIVGSENEKVVLHRGI